MPTQIFFSRYFQYIFDDFKKKYGSTIVLKDPTYWDKRGNHKYMISVKTQKELKETANNISKLIGDYLKMENHPKNPKAPEPLNIII